MDSLREGFTALVIGASGGIGGAIADTLEASSRCGTTIRLSRRHDKLDLTNPESVAEAAERFYAVREKLDLVFDATGVLSIDAHRPEKSVNHIDAGHMAKVLAVNAIGPALLLQHFVPLLTRERKSVFATLSARVGSIGDNKLGGWVSYRASKAALNQIVRTAAIEIARKRPDAVCVALHPGTVETDLSAPFTRDFTFSAGECAERLLGVIDKLGPEQTGSFIDYDGREVPW